MDIRAFTMLIESDDLDVEEESQVRVCSCVRACVRLYICSCSCLCVCSVSLFVLSRFARLYYIGIIMGRWAMNSSFQMRRPRYMYIGIIFCCFPLFLSSYCFRCGVLGLFQALQSFSHFSLFHYFCIGTYSQLIPWIFQNMLDSRQASVNN